ncbi:MAG: hypothetical protein Q8P50_16905 [Bacillota bacterium]|nr:hypothetical protein [Bacillota bacterium]
MRKEGPVAVAFIVGLVVIIVTYFSAKPLVAIKGELDQWYLITTAFAVAVGLVNLARIHTGKIQRKKEGWGYSIVLMVGMIGFILFGMTVSSAGDPKFQWMYNTSIVPMNATMYSILVFYISSAAYRAFRIRTGEAAVLLVAAVIVMLGRVTIGEMISPMLPKWTSWIMNVPNTAGMRAITIGATLGGISQALRVLIGIERGHLGGVE